MHFLERKGFPEDAQKDGEQDIATKTPTVHSNNPSTPNEFAKQLFLLIHNSNGILQRYFISNSFFFSFFYLNFFEPRANNQLWNFRKGVKSRTNRRQGTLLLSPLARFTRFTHSMEFLRKFFINSWTYVVDRMNRNRNVTFARTDRGTKHDWCRLSGTRLISSLSSPRMLIFLPFLPPRFSFVLCPFFVHRHVDLVKTRNVYLVE